HRHFLPFRIKAESGFGKVDEKAGFLYHNFPKHAKSSSNDALDKVPSVGVSKATMSGKKSR
ncbi:MAG: hypothetical protein WC114_09855, partial [Smithellaceae bacterium]